MLKKIGYPVIIRPAYTLGGTGGGISYNREEIKNIAARGIHNSLIDQVLVERSVKGWKELEYEVMRDSNDNCITVCNMENIDPVRIHTGDSMVVAPSQTLADREHQMLRQASIKIIRALVGIGGGCNIQFALDPESDKYYVIEVNPRVSTSFEPALDYVVIKLPRFPFDKFNIAERKLGTQMKAIGEVRSQQKRW